MMRTIGVIFSALMIFVVSLLALLLGALATNIVISTKTRTGALDLFTILIAIVSFAMCGWGFACGVGIVKRREWARTSMLAFGAILLAIAVLGTAKMVLDPTVGLSYLESAYLGSIRPELIPFLACFAAPGGFWLYFFTRNSLKTQFSR
jgi:hypothetical protein